MSLVRWKVWTHAQTIERKEFVRDTTAYFIGATGRREAKESSYYTFHTTEQSAQAALERIQRAEADRKAARRIEAHGAELLAVLEEAVHGTEHHHPLDADRTWLAAAKAVIAKAKGEQPA